MEKVYYMGVEVEEAVSREPDCLEGKVLSSRVNNANSDEPAYCIQRHLAGCEYLRIKDHKQHCGYEFK